VKKRILAALTAICTIMGSVSYAAVLGEQGESWYNTIGKQTNFYSNTFIDETVGNQQEFYVEYTPNSSVIPVIINGSSIWGKRTMTQAVSYMNKNGLIPIAGINADYFSFKTGIPMGHTIIDGELVSKDGTGQNAIGFTRDGKGFISWLEIKSTITSDKGSVNLECINKWCQPNSVPFYFLSDFFGSETKTESDCSFVMFSPVSGKLGIGSEITLVVDERFDYNGSVAIPDGKYVLCLDKTMGDAECRAFLDTLSIGDTVKISSEALYDNDKWAEALNGISSVGERLIENGVVNSNFSAGAHPRTAVGIKADGNVIFYVLDGRQPGYSYGAQLKTLAKRMAELGCVDAINLDGGGSTTIGADIGGDGFKIINSPSETLERSVANFIFLKNNTKPTGIADMITGSFRENNNYLSGAVESFGEIGVLDTAGFKMDVSGLSYSIRNTHSAESYVDDFGNIHLTGQGESIVTISANGITRDVSLFVYTTPDDILVYENGVVTELKKYNFKTGDTFKKDLTADAYLNSAFLNCEDNAFSWSIEGNIGEINSEGEFTLNSTSPAEGAIVVSAGGYSHKIPVSITGEVQKADFADMSGHWAEADVSALAGSGIVNGIEMDGKMYFYPEDKISRIQFATMICNLLGVNVGEYQYLPFEFCDAADFDTWMINYAKAAYSLGFIKGRVTDAGVMFDPKSGITRAEAMVMLSRLKDLGVADKVPMFADISEIPEWAVDAVGTLSSLGVVKGYEDNTINPNGSIKRAEAAVMILRYKSL